MREGAVTASLAGSRKDVHRETEWRRPLHPEPHRRDARAAGHGPLVRKTTRPREARRAVDGSDRAQSVRGCVDIKVQLVLQFGVCWGLGEVLLSILGRGYLSEIVSEFGPLRGPRRRDSENLTHWLISTQVRGRLRAEVPLVDGLAPAGAVRLSH